MIQLTLENLLQFLKSKKYDAHLQSETHQIYIVFKIENKDFPVFFRIFEGGELLQILAFMPGMLKPGTAGDVGRLLHMLNKELDIPGFGMDETSGVVFYRWVLPALGQQIEEKLIETFLNSIQLVCKSFAPVILTVAFGGTTFEDVLKKAKDALAKPPQG